MNTMVTLLKADPGLPLLALLHLTALVTWIWAGLKPSTRLRQLGLLLLAAGALLASMLLLGGGLEPGSLLSRSAALPLVGVDFALLVLVTLILFRGGPARLGSLSSLLAFLLVVLAVPRAVMEVPPSPLLPQVLRLAGLSQILLAGLLALEGLLPEDPAWDFSAGVLKALRAALLLLGGAVVTVLWNAISLLDALQDGDLLSSLLLLVGLGGLLHLHHVKAWRGRGLLWGSLGLMGFLVAGLVVRA